MRISRTSPRHRLRDQSRSADVSKDPGPGVSSCERWSTPCDVVELGFLWCSWLQAPLPRPVTEQLRARGYDVQFVMLKGADHFAPVFHRKVNDELVISAEEPAGEEVLQLITDLLADH